MQQYSDEEILSLYRDEQSRNMALHHLIQKYQPNYTPEDKYFLKEFLLWGLVEYDKLSKDRVLSGYQFKDLYSNYINKL